jgi:hypothetical protein
LRYCAYWRTLCCWHPCSAVVADVAGIIGVAGVTSVTDVNAVAGVTAVDGVPVVDKLEQGIALHIFFPQNFPFRL